MKINYLGHSAFHFCGEKSVVTDPFENIGYDLAKVKADYCLCSHNHFDHNAYKLVDYSVLVKDARDKEKAKGIDLEVIESYHDEVLGTKRGKNNIYKFVIDNFTICHMGDFGEDDVSATLSRIGKVDILLVPVGGTYTINAKKAYELCKLSSAKIIIPMHYKTKKSKIDVSGLDEFLKICKYCVVNKGQEFEIVDLPKEKTVFVPNHENY